MTKDKKATTPILPKLPGFSWWYNTQYNNVIIIDGKKKKN